MTFDLSKEELEIIQGWYQSAAGESASGASIYPPYEHRTDMSKARWGDELLGAVRVRALLHKLGFELHTMDEGPLV